MPRKSLAVIVTILVSATAFSQKKSAEPGATRTRLYCRFSADGEELPIADPPVAPVPPREVERPPPGPHGPADRALRGGSRIPARAPGIAGPQDRPRDPQHDHRSAMVPVLLLHHGR